ncbi:MBL fold metallo-hydrolase [Vibrio sonorensis]|uniref:MBL fold metallo-hydrolase n=1 Tax=Vibrio sonorensis TaxID=1004316 RepID=UPI0008D9AEC8|nr:MBL fold metallo-hydrolase [Vibrio sonorensis]
MEVQILIDNNTIIDRYYLGEPGVCYLIKDGDTKILFDLGYSSTFIDNARKMGEDLLDIDYVAISHGHNDHTGGFHPLIKKYTEAREEGLPHTSPTVIAHPHAFNFKVYDDIEIGSIFSADRIAKHFAVNLTKEPVWLTDNLVFLGQIPRENDFESQHPVGEQHQCGCSSPDFVEDDTALAYKTPEGIVIITGCSHAGICNITEYAKQVCNDDRIVDILGGFHLLNPDEKQVAGTMDYFAKQDIQVMHPCHCTALKYKIEMAAIVPVEDVGVGLKLSY